MEKNLLLVRNMNRMFKSVYEHIKHDCDPKGKRGLIVADDETGELLASVKEALKYEELVAAEKVNEIIVDEHRFSLKGSNSDWRESFSDE